MELTAALSSEVGNLLSRMKRHDNRRICVKRWPHTSIFIPLELGRDGLELNSNHVLKILQASLIESSQDNVGLTLTEGGCADYGRARMGRVKCWAWLWPRPTE